MTRKEIEKRYIKYFFKFLKEKNIYTQFLHELSFFEPYQNYINAHNLDVNMNSYVSFVKSKFPYTKYLTRDILYTLIWDYSSTFPRWRNCKLGIDFWRSKYMQLLNSLSQLRVTKI